MAQLAKHHDGKTLTRLDDLAQREAVSANFLVQILNDLRRASLVDSRRGASGGYILSRPADHISLRQIVEAVEPGLLQPSPAAQGESGLLVKRTWEAVSCKFHADLDVISLESLASPPSDPMFYI